MHKALYPRVDTNRLNVSRKEGVKEIASTEDCIDRAIQGFQEYTKKAKKG